MRRRSVPASLALCALLLASLLGCSDGDDDTSNRDTTTEAAEGGDSTTAPAEPAGVCGSADDPLRIVLVNDDGVINPAIDALIEALGDDEAVELTVVAPADERSGSSDSTTPGGAAYEEATTPAGHEAYAVDGFPADAVGVALDDLGLDPHLVLSGINPGQNFGPLAAISGTVGVGRTAVRRGYPALAVSGGLEIDEEQLAFGADLATDWIAEHCDALLDGSAQTDTVSSINLPDCPVADMGELKEVPVAADVPELPEGEDIFTSTCDQSDPDPADDLAAARAGYPTLSQVPPDISAEG